MNQTGRRVLLIGRIAPVIVAALTATLLVATPWDAVAQPGDEHDGATIIPIEGIAAEQQELLVGDATPAVDDVAFTVMGGPDSLRVLRASSTNDYIWEDFSAIPVPSIETDLWTSAYCMTASGARMVVVYAPRTYANDEELFLGGAWAVVVDLRSGAVTDLGRGFTMAYFNPGCGAGESVALTRYTTDGITQIAVFDTATSEVTFKADVGGQVSSVLPSGKGDVLAFGAAGIVRIGADGKQAALIRTPGVAYDLRLNGRELLYVVRDGDNGALLMSARLDSRRAKSQILASGPLSSLSVATRDGVVYALGEATLAEGSHAVLAPGAAARAKISSGGRIAVGVAVPQGLGSDGLGSAPELSARVEATAIATGNEIWFELPSAAESTLISSLDDGTAVRPNTAPASNAVAPLDVGTRAAITLPQAATPAAAPGAGAAAMGSPTDPIEGTNERMCAVPRNDPHNQAYQPKPRQVEWAVDRAVLGQLNESRSSNWRNLGIGPYTPQGLFPRVNLTGGGTIPPQIVLGVLAQESNMWQASRYTAPGSTGNPLIGDYYGSRPGAGDPPESIWNIDFSDADCGYGVGQITDGMRLSDNTLTTQQQRAIALDYAANVAMAVRMVGQKWNEIAGAGMQINNGSSSKIENWFFAVWIYNTGFHPQGSGSAGNPHWGVGWSNNPMNTAYPANRGSFLDGSPSDAAHPSDWPYPEKVMGFAAHGITLVETQIADASTRGYPEISVVAGFRTAWWNGEGEVGEDRRTAVKPPIDLFCDYLKNSCTTNLLIGYGCTITSGPAAYECWWHDDATWKTDCNLECGNGFERFPASYAAEADALLPSLLAATRQMSFPANCASGNAGPVVGGYAAAPAGALIVDDTTQLPVRSDCTYQSSQGSFGFQFYSPDSNDSYSGKIDLHQLGGGFNGHFYFSKMRSSADTINNPNDRLKVTGTWTLGQSLNQWTRVWIHLPDHAGWTDQAAYTINYGNGSQVRYLPQRRYANSWVPIGVFQVNGTPSVSLSNITPDSSNENYDDIAWDAVAFQPLSAKPSDFVVALGDSFSSGEGAGSYSAWSDHDGSSPGAAPGTAAKRNGCHQSSNAWVLKTVIPNRGGQTIAQRLNGAGLDFHFLACSGAETENLLPYYSVPANQRPGNGDDTTNEAQDARNGQYQLVSQLDAGYLDANTTLVTLSIGGNDIGFAEIIPICILSVEDGCRVGHFGGDPMTLEERTNDRMTRTLPVGLAAVIEAIKAKAPNADIVLMGYPALFDQGFSCVLMVDQPWLNEVSVALSQTMQQAADAAELTSPNDIVFADPQPFFEDHTLCVDPSGINGLVLATTPGDLPFGWFDENYALQITPVSQESIHPNSYGTDLYADALEAALAGIYP